MPKFKTGGENSKKRLLLRLYLLGAFFAIAYGILISRAFYFHLKDNTEIEKVAMRQYRTAVKKSTERGRILDSEGRELAISHPSESVYADPRLIKDPKIAAKQINKILNIDESKLIKLLSSKRKFVWIKRRLSKKESELLKKTDIPGVAIMVEKGRSYPNGRLGSSVLGMVGVDAKGLGGIEYQYNDLLLVNKKDDSYRRDARGHIYISPTGDKELKQDSEIELTIDKTIQYIAERELAEALKTSKAKSGVIIALDVTNGDVLAMASLPSFDPNKYGDFPQESWKNRAISDVYEPGSTFKAVVVASALDRNLVTEDQVFDCSKGSLKVGNVAITDAHQHKKLSVADIIKLSSNVGAAHIESKIGKEQLYEDILKFGFGNATEIELPGESSGILSPPSKWSEIQYVTIAFGYGIGATPLQMSLAFASIVNGGELLVPHIIKRIKGYNGEVFYEREKKVLRHVIKKETSDLMKTLLQGVVEDGTGVLAASSEYLVGGKTGTAKKINLKEGGYLKDKYYSSFIGFGPANRPNIVVYVGIDEPKGYYYGGQVAAPVFRNVVEEVLRYLNVPSQKQNIRSVALNDKLLEESLLFKDPEVVTNDMVIKQVNEGKWVIPDFSGMTIRQVLNVIGNAEIEMDIKGSGIAVNQKPFPGAIIGSGAKCKVEFKNLF